MSIDSFISKVRYGPTCWLWLGARSRGYGMYGGEGAHRVAWKIAFGPIPKRLDVLHYCDRPSCVNPFHLWVGTHQDNMDDMVAKGRSRAPRGEEAPWAKLTNSQVKIIRQLGRIRGMQSTLARRFGVSQAAIWYALTGKNWSYL